MAIKLQDKPNVLAPGGAYPYGDILDNPGDNTGTPVNREVYADFHQFFAAMLAYGYQTANGLPDNATNTFQYFESLFDVINKNIGTSIIKGLLNSYTTNDVIILWGCVVTANIPGTSIITQGAIFYNDKVYLVSAASVPSPSDTLVFRIDNTVNPNKIYLANGISSSGIAEYSQPSVKTLLSILSLLYKLQETTPVTVTPNTGWTAFIGQPLQYSKKGNVVYLSGAMQRSTGGTDISCVLPFGFRPSRKVQIYTYGVISPGTNTSFYIQISTAGEIEDPTSALATGDLFYLDGISFTI